MLKIPKNSAKKLIFWLIFKIFSIVSSFALWVTPQFICQMKGLMKVNTRGKFQLCNICGCEVIKFQMFSWRWSTDEIAHFWGEGERWWWGRVLGPKSPQNGPILLKFLPEVVRKDTESVFEESLKNSNFYRNGRYRKFGRLVQLWAQFTPWRWPKSGKTKTRTTKIQPSGYPTLSTPTP